MIRNDFYSGFEGEPMITFVFKSSPLEKIDMWTGYFDRLIDLGEPDEHGCWQGLALYYHTDTGWYDEAEWQIPDIPQIIAEFDSLDTSACDNAIIEELRTAILNFLKKAHERNKPVLIRYE
ncbi:hypothetical protein [Taibaiella chishuiensis]|uniref:Uncharacterized protein n=1 Tax=Taibaiella chishuiensis TaxID=1434707 RepID=A0A2P8D7G0_9BACT|nr:hypothetical protein [Taibaiella chishuiensis]PSK93127.1 hypothetical protein B0I18_10296 [Taibaiella chishuiensis]